MDRSPEQRPAAGRGPERRSGSFRVCTVDDFELNRQGTPGRRKSGQLTTACQNCRARKVKCTFREGSYQPRRLRSHPRCQPCEQSNLECCWDGIDRRRRRYKSRPVAVIQTGGSNGPAGQISADFALLESGAALTPNQQELGFGPDGIRRVNRPMDMGQGATPSRNSAQAQWVASTNEAQLDTSQLQGPGQFMAELCPDGDMGFSQDCPDLQDFILGLDFLGEGGNATLYPGSANASGQTPLERTISQRPRLVRLRYYRRFGPTAVIPGLRRLSVVVDPEQEESPTDGDRPEAGYTPSSGDNSSPGSTASNQSRLFDKHSREPHPDMVPRILDVFFDHFGGHFPFLNAQILGGHVRSGEASSFLLNAIAALTVRFFPLDGELAVLQRGSDVPWRRGAPFLKKAKEQIVPLLSIPAPEVVGGLLILAWAEFGDNNEAGLWMFAGMAIRMAQDLGLHRTPDTDVDPNISFHDHARPSPDGGYILTDEQSIVHQKKARLVMFWSVFIMDVCVSLVTGRPPTIRRDEIGVPIPTAQDMKLAQLDFKNTVSMQNVIFPDTVRFMLRFSAVLETLNQRVPSRSPERSVEPGSGDGHLSQLRNEMVEAYSLLPLELAFSTDNFRESAVSRQSGLFLMLHLFFYTFMTLLSSTYSRDARNGLRQAQSRRPSASDIYSYMRPPQLSRENEHEHQPRIAATACQKMVQIVTVADLVDRVGFLATPFVNHCLFVAASTILQGTEALNVGTQQPHGSFSSVVADTDYEFLHCRLQDQGRYFGAVNSVVSVLEQRQRACVDGENNEVQMSDEEAEGGMQRVVGLGDTGIVNRYTIPRRE